MAESKTAPTEPKVKPTKPNEDAFKADLAQAEKEHAAVQEKLVRMPGCLEFGIEGCSPPQL